MSSPRTKRWWPSASLLVLTLGVAIAALIGLRRDRREPNAPREVSSLRGEPVNPPGAVARAETAAVTADPGRRAAPWDATPESSPPVPAGHVPAWEVAPPAPASPPARPIRLPDDPARSRPAMHNPGGVDGVRPPRPVPGL
jgi:hypothetical protein